MLLDLQSAVVENRVASYTVGELICGREMFAERLENARKEWDENA